MLVPQPSNLAVGATLSMGLLPALPPQPVTPGLLTPHQHSELLTVSRWLIYLSISPTNPLKDTPARHCAWSLVNAPETYIDVHCFKIRVFAILITCHFRNTLAFSGSQITLLDKVLPGLRMSPDAPVPRESPTPTAWVLSKYLLNKLIHSGN